MNIGKYLKKPKNVIIGLKNHGFFNWLPDKPYLKMSYRLALSRKLDLKNPKTFNEKLQWLKLYDRKDIYTKMVDKYEVKKYIAERIGEEYVIPNYGVWDKFDDIDFDALPDQFVLKCTHDSGGLVIVRDKSKFDKEKARKKINKSLKRNYYHHGREWPYKNVKPRIIAEKYMEDMSSRELVDYKFYCFNGKPEFLYVSTGLEDHSTAAISFLTMNFQFAPYQRSDFKPFETLPNKPKNFEKMAALASALSTNIDFLRVDLYEINGNVYFSELTFSPCSGYMPFKNMEHDSEIGNMLHLSKK